MGIHRPGAPANGARRAWYPSGPWVDGIKPPGHPDNSPPSCPAARLRPEPPNPDPANYRVEGVLPVGRFLVVKILYPDATNFEGRKILVFDGVTAADLLVQKVIDPHFFPAGTLGAGVASPVARFVPTPAGWEMAVTFCRAMGRKGKRDG